MSAQTRDTSLGTVVVSVGDLAGHRQLHGDKADTVTAKLHFERPTS
jgi:hypothetical protein